jgi:hypothetical protein
VPRKIFIPKRVDVIRLWRKAQWIIEGRGRRAGFYGPSLIHTYKIMEKTERTDS